MKSFPQQYVYKCLWNSVEKLMNYMKYKAVYAVDNYKLLPFLLLNDKFIEKKKDLC